MKNSLISLIIVGLFACVSDPPIKIDKFDKKPLGPIATWTHNDTRLCVPTLAQGLAGLPFDIGVTINRTNLPFGRYDGLASRRPFIIHKDLSLDNRMADFFKDDEGTAGTGFGVFSADGTIAYTQRRYEDPQWAMYEEALGAMDLSDLSKYLIDTYSFNLQTGEVLNLSGGANRISNINQGPILWPKDPTRVVISSVINGVGLPFLTSSTNGAFTQLFAADHFSYGLNPSPNGKWYALHSDYKIFIGDTTTQEEWAVPSPYPFNFAPIFSPDSQHIIFSCGQGNPATDYCMADIDTNGQGSNVRSIGSKNGYRGANNYVDGDDFHGGGSDNPVWSPDSSSVLYGAMVGSNVELFRAQLNGTRAQFTFTQTIGAENYNPVLSPDTQTLMYISKRLGQRNIFIMDMTTKIETQVTNLDAGCGTLYPTWRNQ